MSMRITNVSRSQVKEYRGRNRFEHWQIDYPSNFITDR
mgnify:CR=1 FL=1